MTIAWTREDIKQCNELACVSPEAMRVAALMAELSIQQSWSLVPAAMLDVSLEGDKSKYLWGFKADTYAYLHDTLNMRFLYANTITMSDPVELLDLWTTVPGLGLAKAGFVVQLTRGMVGCVDGHNAAAYDVKLNQLTFPKGRITLKAQQHKLKAYVNLTKAIGGSEFMWQQWCVLMAGKYPEQYASAKAVSNQHVQTLARHTP